MSDMLIDILGVVPVQLLFAYALTKMLDIRNHVAFWALEIAVVLSISCFRSYMGAEFRLAASVPLAVIPIVLSEGGLARRILTVALAHLVLFFAELPSGVLWITLTGTPVADYDAVREHFDAFVMVHAVHYALLIPLFVMLYLLLKRFFSKDRGAVAWLPVLFTLTQLVLTNTLILLPLGYVEESLQYYAVAVLLSLGGFAADLLLLLAIARFSQKQRDDARAVMLEEQIDVYLLQYEAFVESIERTARLRHDMGNHLQVVLALSERGRFREARGHLDLVRGDLAGFEEDGKAVS